MNNKRKSAIKWILIAFISCVSITASLEIINLELAKWLSFPIGMLIGHISFWKYIDEVGF